MEHICIIHNLARCGGTLFSKCIACLKNIVLLSEIHPESELIFPDQNFNLINQFKLWYAYDLEYFHRVGLITEFRENFIRIFNTCNTHKKQLVIRDWAQLDFIPIPYLNNQKIKFKFSLDNEIKDISNLKHIAIIRNPIDQWLSLKKFNGMEELSVKDYLAGYLRYIKEINNNNITIIKYEDFIEDPISQIKIAAKELKIQFDYDFTNKCFHYNKITGDVIGVNSSGRGIGLMSFEKLPRIDDTKNLTIIKSENLLYEILELTGYKEK